MAYDLSNPTNVNNYVSGYQGYVPQNGSLGMPSAGWDGWNGYNNNTTYSANGLNPINLPGQTTPTMGGMPGGPQGQNIKAGRPDLATMTSALTGNYLDQYNQMIQNRPNANLYGIAKGLYQKQLNPRSGDATRPRAGSVTPNIPFNRGLGNIGSTTQVDASGNDMTPAPAPPPTPYGWMPGENMSYYTAIKNNSTNVPGIGYIPNAYFQNNSNGSYIQSQPFSALSQYTPPPMPPAGSSGSSIGYGANGLYWNQG